MGEAEHNSGAAHDIKFICSAATADKDDGESEENALGETDSDGDDDARVWQDGDGICPTLTDFEDCRQKSYDTWRLAAMESPGSLVTHLDDILSLVKNVPRFYLSPGGSDVSGGYKCPLIIRSFLRIETAPEGPCDKRWKRVDFSQCLGFPSPKFFEKKCASSQCPFLSFPSLRIDQASLTTVTLAWSYILSCRWAEICQSAGERIMLLHRDGLNFWELITRSCWSARMQRGRGTIFSPWQLQEYGSSTDESRQWVEVSPNSASAFDTLLRFCASENLLNEFLTGFANVLMLPSRNTPLPRMESPVPVSHSSARRATHDAGFQRLLEDMDRFMYLSATQDALDSIMCSAFFDPSVPCNLVGAASLGIKQAVLTGNNEYHLFLRAIAIKKPHISFLWNAAVSSGQAKSLLSMALMDLPPVCLPAALWTNTLQSFLQVEYCPDDLEKGAISRANEFATSFFCREEVPVPWTPSPPFGTTTVRNLSLEVREHYEHDHRLLSWEIGSTSTHNCARYSMQLPLTTLLSPSGADSGVTTSGALRTKSDEEKDAELQSLNATSRLFNWHRCHDDGLWLDDGTRAIESIRSLQRHPWIVDPFDVDNEPNSSRDTTKSKTRDSTILRWMERIETARSLDPCSRGRQALVAGKLPR